MNLVYTTNNLFAAKVGASICSVFENNRVEEEIIVYIIGQDISFENRIRFQKLAEVYNRKVSIINISDVEKLFDFDFDTLGWNSIILARLMIAKLLPDTIHRVLYLDGDTIALQSLSELWETDLGGKVIGACIEATVDYSRRVQLGMQNIPYVNSGVLLIDLDKWRKDETDKRIITYYKESGGRLFAPDQDAINGALKKEIYYLPPKYNFYNIYWTYSYQFLRKLMRDTEYYNEDIYKESCDSPAIIHYLGEERPWRKGNKHKYREDYKKYLQKTPWRREKDETGWEVYFVCWNMFNILMKPFPGLRYSIINKLIPWFMKYRKMKLRKNG